MSAHTQRRVEHTLRCGEDGPCGARLVLEIEDPHELRSVGQVVDDLAVIAGWRNTPGLGWRCADHRRIDEDTEEYTKKIAGVVIVARGRT